MSDEPMFRSDDPIGEIDDRIARYLARTIVHVRRFLPFYAGGIAFFVAMLVLPVVRDGDSGVPASVAGPSGASSAVSRAGTTAAAASGARTATGAGAAAAGILGGDSSGLVSFFSDDGGSGLGGEVADGASAGGAGAIDGRRTGGSTTVDTPSGVPDTPSSDLGDAPEEPTACSLSAPSPAPTVTPSHEISGAQDTVESAAHQQLPADVADTTAPVSNDAVCSVPDAPVDVPSVPLPATPVGGPTAGNPVLRLALALLFG